MVYVASLSYTAKKALGQKCRQSNIQGIIDNITLEPAISHMDVVLFGPRDLDGPAGKQIPAAVEKRHPNVCVIYLCTKDKELKLYPNAPHVKQVKKLDGAAINDAISEFYGQDINVTDQKYNSASDKIADLGKNPTPPKPVAPPVKEEIIPEPPVEMVVEPVPEEVPEPPKAEAVVTAEDMIASVHDVKDWDLLKKQLRRDSIISQLILENNEFAGLVNMLDVWDLRIREIWADQHKSNEEKMNAVREFGTNRQVLQATYNSVLVNKFVSLVERVVSCCTSTVEERVDAITTAVVSIQTQKSEFLEHALSGDDSLYDTLYSRVLELKYIEGELIKMFAFINEEGNNEILKRMDEKLPSTNEFINNTLSVSRSLFLPNNTGNLGQMIMDALGKGQVQLSMVSDKVTGLMNTLFDVILAQDEVIRYQRDVIDCLRANHVESLVVRDSLLKNCFRIFLGDANTGLTATVAIYAGMLSRRDTLVVDLSGHPHYDRYGYEVTELDAFMTERIQKPLLFVVGDVGNDPEKVFKLMEELKSRLTYFRHLIIVLDPAQKGILDQVGREALSIAYVTNCTLESMASISEAYEKGRALPNVAHILACIDSPVDAGMLLTTLKMDISMTKIVPIPYMREIRQAAIVRQQPHTYNDVFRVFEEAFRA
mgnify:CR=1 FL=1